MFIKKPGKHIALLLISILMVACTNNEKALNAKKHYSVNMYEGFYLGRLLDVQEKIDSIKKVKELFNKNWYAEIKVSANESKFKNKNIKNCLEYFDAKSFKAEPVKENERAAYFEFGLMCQAAKSIMNAEPAKITFLSAFKFDKKLPLLLPKQFSMVTSEVENKKIMADGKFIFWGDVNKIKEVKNLSEYSGIFKTPNSMQELTLVAKADFNDDKIEDLLLISKGSVDGGSYHITQMFLITKYSKAGRYILLKEF